VRYSRSCIAAHRTDAVTFRYNGKSEFPIKNGRMPSQYLIVSVGQRRCAFPVESVSETMRPPRLSTLPSAPAFISGVGRVRGEIIVVVDGRALLACEPLPAELPGAQRMVVLKAGDRTFGLTVDSVEMVTEIAEDANQALSTMLPVITEAYVSKIAEMGSDFVAVLDSARIVPAAVWQQFEANNG
jgi:chemotaxis signal transduction protein